MVSTLPALSIPDAGRGVDEIGDASGLPALPAIYENGSAVKARLLCPAPPVVD